MSLVDIYNFVKLNGFPSKTILQCGLAAYLSIENDKIIRRELINYYFIGFPVVRDKGVFADVDLDRCKTDDTKLLDLIKDNPTLMKEVHKELLNNYINEFPKINSFVSHIESIMDENERTEERDTLFDEFDFDFHLDKINCYEQTYFQFLLKVYGLTRSDTSDMDQFFQKLTRNTRCNSNYFKIEKAVLKQRVFGNFYNEFTQTSIFGDFFDPIFKNTFSGKFKLNYELFKFQEGLHEYEYSSKLYTQQLINYYYLGHNKYAIEKDIQKGLEKVKEFIMTDDDHKKNVLYYLSKINNMLKEKEYSEFTDEEIKEMVGYLFNSVHFQKNEFSSFFLAYNKIKLKSGRELELINKFFHHFNKKNLDNESCVVQLIYDYPKKEYYQKEPLPILIKCMYTYPTDIHLLKNLMIPERNDIVNLNIQGYNVFSMNYYLKLLQRNKLYYTLFVDYPVNLKQRDNLSTIAYYAYSGVSSKIRELYDHIKFKGHKKLETFLELKALFNGDTWSIPLFCEKYIDNRFFYNKQVYNLSQFCKVLLKKDFKINKSPHSLYLLLNKCRYSLERADYDSLKWMTSKKILNITNMFTLFLVWLRNSLYSLFEILQSLFSYLKKLSFHLDHHIRTSYLN